MLTSAEEAAQPDEGQREGELEGGKKKKNKGGADKYKYKLKIYRSSYFWKVLMNFIVIQMYNLFLVLNGYCS